MSHPIRHILVKDGVAGGEEPPGSRGCRGCLSPPDFTGMAQRQRAGLITPRSPDRNGLPVFILRKLYRSCHGDNRQVGGGGCLSPLLALNSVYSAAELGQ